MKKYDYVIIGAGIAGCSVAYFLKNYSNNVLLIDRCKDLSNSASSVAGGFLSPLLGKPNNFKNIVTTALKYSMNLYKKNFKDELINKGVLRIPKNSEDEKKFKEYIPHIDFEYTLKDGGCFFPIGSQVLTQKLCEKMIKNVDTNFNFYVENIEFKNNEYILNNEIIAKNLILTTGVDLNLIEDNYFDIRAVWGQRIVATTTSWIYKNYHKACSISTTNKSENGLNIVNIGATHNRFESSSVKFKEYLKDLDVSILQNEVDVKKDTQKLIEYAQDIIKLENLEVVEVKLGARASSIDYFPIVGELVDEKRTIEKFPYMKNGTNVPNDKLIKRKNLYVLNGLGGRGFVLAPYLANILVEHIMNGHQIPEEIASYRLFKRWIKRAN